MIPLWIDLYRRVREATALRDDVNRKISSPQAMTVGEQIVWAAEFLRVLAMKKRGSADQHRARAADMAAITVLELRAVNWLRLNVGARSMYITMIERRRRKKAAPC